MLSTVTCSKAGMALTDSGLKSKSHIQIEHAKQLPFGNETFIWVYSSMYILTQLLKHDSWFN